MSRVAPVAPPSAACTVALLLHRDVLEREPQFVALQHAPRMHAMPRKDRVFRHRLLLASLMPAGKPVVRCSDRRSSGQQPACHQHVLLLRPMRTEHCELRRSRKHQARQDRHVIC